MRRLLLAIALLFLICLILFAAGAIDIGLFRWPVKTFRDRDRARVRLAPVDTTVAALTRLPRPPDSVFRGHSRIAPEELSVYRVRARLRRVLGGTDGDMHLILVDPADSSATMIAEIPSPLLSIGSGLGRIFAAERAEVARRSRHRGELIEVTGVGFFDYYAGGNAKKGFELHPVAGGHAKNGFELHPVIGLKFLGTQ